MDLGGKPHGVIRPDDAPDARRAEVAGHEPLHASFLRSLCEGDLIHQSLVIHRRYDSVNPTQELHYIFFRSLEIHGSDSDPSLPKSVIGGSGRR